MIEETIWCLPSWVSAKPSCFTKDHHLASKKVVSVHWPCTLSATKLCTGESMNLSTIFQRNYSAPSRWIRKFGVNDRGAIVNFVRLDWMPILFQVAFSRNIWTEKYHLVPLAEKWNNAYWICAEWKSGIKELGKAIWKNYGNIYSSQSIGGGYG